MPSSESNIVEVVKPEAELRADEGVGRRIHFSSDAVGLEAKNARSNIVHVISPTCYHRVSINFGAGNSCSRQGAFE